MSFKLKKPKEFLHHGNDAARLRKSAMANLTNQSALDAFLEALPPAMRDIALERVRPYLSFIPMQDQVEPVSTVRQAEQGETTDGEHQTDTADRADDSGAGIGTS